MAEYQLSPRMAKGIVSSLMLQQKSQSLVTDQYEHRLSFLKVYMNKEYHVIF